MYKHFFENMEWTALPVFALGLFGSMFVLVVLRTFAYKSPSDFAAQSELPLSDGKEIV